MGLDMYLTANRYESRLRFDPKHDESTYNALVEASGLKHLVDPDDDISSVIVKVRVGYWRKANAIHQWFVQNVQGGKDDCSEFDVSREQLSSLQALCEELLKSRNAQEAAEKLPPQAGFFFGSTEIDEWYWQDLEQTVKILKRALGEPQVKGIWFEYRASW